MLEVFRDSEFVNGETNNIAMLEQNQIVISATKPLTDEDGKCAFYDVDLLKLNGSQLKIGTFRISTPLDDEIKGTPELVYLKKQMIVKLKP